MESGHESEVYGPRRTHIAVEIVLRILAILVRHHNTDTNNHINDNIHFSLGLLVC